MLQMQTVFIVHLRVYRVGVKKTNIEKEKYQVTG